jgi:hypothetical protein
MDLLEIVGRRIKPWIVQKTFDNALDAKRYAARMFVLANGVRVAPFAGDTFTVFTWTKEVE